MRNSKEKHRVNKKKVLIITTLSIISFCLLVLGTGYFYVKAKIYTKSEPKVNEEVVEKTEKKATTDNKPKEEKVDYEEVEGITNILLIGIDGIKFDENEQRSDSMIIATVNNNTKKVKLTSLYRDTLVYIPGHGEDKMNNSFSLGGPELVMDTIRYNYDLDIDKYILVNFAGFETILDQIGGVKIDVQDYQLHELNKYIGEATGGNDCPVEEAGLQLLNGKQALAYSRIRKGVGDDFERTGRQREVLFKVAEKLQHTSHLKYLTIGTKMLDYLKTNIEISECLNLAYTMSKCDTSDMQQLSIPVEELSSNQTINGREFLVMDAEENAEILHDFIYYDIIPDVVLNRSGEKDTSRYYEYDGFSE